MTDKVIVEDEKLKLGRLLTGTLSHQLTSSLISINLMANFLEKHFRHMDFHNESVLSQEDANKVSNTPHLMIEQIKEINRHLDLIQQHYAIIDRDHYPLSILSAETCVNATLESYTVFQKHRDRLDWDEKNEFTFLGNETLVHCVLASLLDNALSAINKRGDGKIILRLQYKDDKPVICLTNTGGGLTEKNHEYLFDPFYTNDRHRVGMGLFFCKKAMDAMEGKISCQSSVDRVIFILEFSDGKNYG